MNQALLPQLLLCVLAFALGFGMARVSLCAVAAARAGVEQRDLGGLARLLLATAAAGLAILLVRWWRPELAPLPAGPALAWPLIWGGILLGLGALLNGGCYLGSLSYLGTGNYHYLFTLLGFAAAARYFPPGTMAGAMNQQTFLPWLPALLIFAVLVFLGLRHRPVALKKALPLRGAWPWNYAALACGCIAGLIALVQPGWSYSRWLEMVAAGNASSLPWLLHLSTLAIFLGVTSSARLAGTFRWPPLSIVKSARCLAGGTLMGYAAAHIPGGNDALLLWAVPSLALYGMVAYALMLATLALAFTLGRRLARR